MPSLLDPSKIPTGPLSEEEKTLLRSLFDVVGVQEPFSFAIRKPDGTEIEAEGTKEFFSASHIRSMFSIYARYLIGTIRLLEEAQARVDELEAQQPEVLTFSKSPKAPIRVDDV
jgi:hypothetical protein